MLNYPNPMLHYPNPEAIRGGAKEFELYNNAVEKRQNKYPMQPIANPEIVEQLNEDGYVIVKNGIDIDKINRLKDETNAFLKTPKAVTGGRFSKVPIPLVDLPTPILPIACDEWLVDVVSGYLNCFPALTHSNLRRSHIVSDAKQTQLFHTDPNAHKFLKVFFYLNDVDIDGGPFVFVKGSHRLKFPKWLSKDRWGNNAIEKIYGKDQVKYLTANMGDVIIADTTGFHRGLPPKGQERTMLTLGYTAHPMQWKKPDHPIASSAISDIPNNMNGLIDFLLPLK